MGEPELSEFIDMPDVKRLVLRYLGPEIELLKLAQDSGGILTDLGPVKLPVVIPDVRQTLVSRTGRHFAEVIPDSFRDTIYCRNWSLTIINSESQLVYTCNWSRVRSNKLEPALFHKYLSDLKDIRGITRGEFHEAIEGATYGGGIRMNETPCYNGCQNLDSNIYVRRVSEYDFERTDAFSQEYKANFQFYCDCILQTCEVIYTMNEEKMDCKFHFLAPEIVPTRAYKVLTRTDLVSGITKQFLAFENGAQLRTINNEICDTIAWKRGLPNPDRPKKR